MNPTETSPTLVTPTFLSRKPSNLLVNHVDARKFTDSRVQVTGFSGIDPVLTTLGNLLQESKNNQSSMVRIGSG